jgi:glycerol-3-phosphate dehydrogenase (NAD(P)+)
MHISVLGAGGWGTTLSIILCNNGHDVSLWEFDAEYAAQLRQTRINERFLPGIPIPPSIKITEDIKEAATGRELIVLAVPSQFLRGAIKGLSKEDLNNSVLVSVAKGIEKGSLLTMSQMLRGQFPFLEIEQIGVLSGPSHAEEVARQIPTAVVAASGSYKTSKLIQKAFMTSYFRVYSSTDILGVELGGAFKNVIAIGAGIIDGAGFGDNTKAAIMTRGIAEISRLGIALGAAPETFAGLSGMGDVIVTCMSKHSRNRYVGEQIGSGKKLNEVLGSMKMVAEGVETSRSAAQLAGKYNVETPITQQVYKILFEDKDPVEATNDLMTRDMKHEIE